MSETLLQETCSVSPIPPKNPKIEENAQINWIICDLVSKIKSPAHFACVALMRNCESIAQIESLRSFIFNSSPILVHPTETGNKILLLFGQMAKRALKVNEIVFLAKNYPEIEKM